MENLKETRLSYPTVETWFIGWDDNRTQIKTYGSVSPTQTMVSPWDEMDFYEDEQVWLQVLLDNGIDFFLEPEDETDL
jgi:hypothetical protein|tara:strand:- start:3133 stop:3366 length:234 start_codon:yes stop_codon:yes gene_type:complete